MTSEAQFIGNSLTTGLSIPDRVRRVIMADVTPRFVHECTKYVLRR
jgi:hypothetical protein